MRIFHRTAAAFLLFSLGAVPAAAQQLSPAVIVIIDMDQVVNECAAGKQAGAELQAKVTALQARANTLQTQLKTDADSIQQGQAAKTLAGAALEQRARAFQDKQQAAQQEIGRMENDIQRSRQYVIKQINDAAQPIITQVMRERNASIALAEGATLQHSASIDVTNDVIARLNTSLPRVSVAAPAAPAAPAGTPQR